MMILTLFLYRSPSVVKASVGLLALSTLLLIAVLNRQSRVTKDSDLIQMKSWKYLFLISLRVSALSVLQNRVLLSLWCRGDIKKSDRDFF